MEFIQSAVIESALRLGREHAALVEAELVRLLDAGHLISHTARCGGDFARTLVMSGNLVLAEVATVRDGLRFGIHRIQYEGDGIPLEYLPKGHRYGDRTGDPP
jgi:hypothetical protein